ncbi:MAG: CBS domain-containing protein [Patescibacteria group bacterium]|nr:CBS domain-containing protein [Patescibacteria group bacterium]
MSNSERFLAAFNRIEKHLASLRRGYGHRGMRELLRRLRNRYKLVRVFEEDLREFSELRNAIVHRTTGQTIAEPKLATVDRIEHIARALINPPSVMEIASKPVFVCDIKTSVDAVVKKMAEKEFEHVPVYNGKNFVGVFSDISIMKWLAARAGSCELSRLTMNDMKAYLDKPDLGVNGYQFVPRRMDIFELQDRFLSFMDEKKQLGALFITETGKRSEPVLGVVTPRSLPKIKQLK